MTGRVALAAFVMTAPVLIFGAVLPKTCAITNAEGAASRMAPRIRGVILVFAPVVTVVRARVRLLLRLFGVRAGPNGQIQALREEIAGAIALGHSGGLWKRKTATACWVTLIRTAVPWTGSCITAARLKWLMPTAAPTKS